VKKKKVLPPQTPADVLESSELIEVVIAGMRGGIHQDVEKMRGGACRIERKKQQDRVSGAV